MTDAPRIVVRGPDRGLAAAFESRGAAVERPDRATADALDAAGIADADAFVLTTVDDAVALVTAIDANPDLRAVVYADGSLPDFARAAADLILDPDLFDPDAVAEELAGGG